MMLKNDEIINIDALVTHPVKVGLVVPDAKVIRMSSNRLRI